MNIQSIAEIGQIVRNAVAFNLKTWPGGTMHSDTLPGAVVQLFQLLDDRHVPYVLVGGIALLQYVEGRNTEDIDLIMALSDLRTLPEIRIESQDNDFARGRYGALQLDVLLTSNRLFDAVQRNYWKTQQLDERTIRCATVEGIMLLKLYALPSLYRQGDFARVGLYENDLATLMHYYRPDLDSLLSEVAAYVSKSDLHALQDIVADLQKRIQRFKAGIDANT